jgi:hypothetical protein
MRRRLLVGAGAALVATVAVLALPVSPLAKANPPAGPKLPATIQGLTVKREDITKTLKEDRRQLYVDGVWLYSLRQGKELMATVELGRFRSVAPWQDSTFDLSLAGQLGGSVPAVVRVDGTPVYISTTHGLQLASWERHGYLVIVGIRNSYKSPKDLLRQVLEVTP